MIAFDLQNKIIEKIINQTETEKLDWRISGPEIEARECLIYKASNTHYPHSIAIKVYRKNLRHDSIAQYDVLEQFNQSLNQINNQFYVPKVFGSFPEEGVFLMEWINSPTLERRLWRYFYSKKQVQNDMSLVFNWLSEFHHSSNISSKTVAIEYYEKRLEETIKTHNGLELFKDNKVFLGGKISFSKHIKNYNNFSTLHANHHGDFTPSNILIDDEKVTAIDISGKQLTPIENDIALQFAYIAIEYPNMLTRFDFKLEPPEWPLLKLIFNAYGYSKEIKQLRFFLLIFMYQLLRRWIIIKNRTHESGMSLLDRWRLKNSEMIVKHLTDAIEKIHL